MYDIILIGSGHNGLVTVAKLAKDAGIKKSLVLEKADLLGGCTRTDPNILPGCKVPTGAGSLQAPLRGTIKDFQLETFGLEVIELPKNEPYLYYFVGEHYEKRIPIYQDIEATCEGIAKYSIQEANNYRRMCQDWAPFSRLIGQIYRWTDPSYAEIFKMLESMGQKAMWLYMSSASEILRSYFSADWMGGIGRMVWSASCAPLDYPGTGFTTQYLPRVHWSVPLRVRGHCAAYIEALARYIEHQGGEVKKGKGVSKILIEDGQAKGVRLESGEEIAGRIIVSGAHPKITYLKLVGEENLKPDFADWVRRQKEATSMFTVHLLLDQPVPVIGGHSGRGFRQIEQASHARLEKRLYEPLLAMGSHSRYDPSLAPPGKGFFSPNDIVPYHIEGMGATWDEIKEKRADEAIDTLQEIYPEFDWRRHIVERQILTPLDYEKDFNLWEGSIMGPAITLDQMFSMRLPYRAPIKNLYVTGQGTHPVAGAIAVPGYNAAKIIREDLEKGRIRMS